MESLQLAVEDNISSSLSAIDKTAKNIILGSNVRQFLREGANLAEMDESGKVLLRQSIEREISNQMLFNSILEEGLIESVNFYLDEHNIAFFPGTEAWISRTLPLSGRCTAPYSKNPAQTRRFFLLLSMIRSCILPTGFPPWTNPAVLFI